MGDPLDPVDRCAAQWAQAIKTGLEPLVASAIKAGMTSEQVERAVEIALVRTNGAWPSVGRYFCGIMKRFLAGGRVWYDSGKYTLGMKVDKRAEARRMRESMTPSETALWLRLKDNQLGVRFRAQVPLCGFIVDFYCLKHRLVIEVDGEAHNADYQRVYDDIRTRVLSRTRRHVIRFSNAQVAHSIEDVVETIRYEVRLRGGVLVTRT